MRANEERVNRYRRLIEQHRAEGGPVTQFCKRHGISHWTFRDWRRRLGAGHGRRPGRFPRRLPAAPGFIPVVAAAVEQVAGEGFEVTLRSGTRLRIPRGYDKGELRTLLRLLRG